MGMNDWEIRWALLEAARQNMVSILDEEMRLDSLIANLPEPEIILGMLLKRLGLDDSGQLPEDVSNEDIAEVAKAIRFSLGDAVSEAFKDVMKQPKFLKAIRKLFSTHPDDFTALGEELSRRYSDVLLNFAERYVETPNWIKTQSLIIIADSLVNNVSGRERSRLDARLEVNWGVYLWKCGDYSEAERKFQNASDAIAELVKKAGKEDASAAEAAMNAELQVRVLQGFGLLYGDLLEDKTQSIGFNKACLVKLAELEDTYLRRKMKATIFNNLGVAYHRMAEQFPDNKENHLTEAALHYEEALNIARSIHYTRMVGWVLFNAGEIYAYLGQLEKAARYSAESRKIFSINLPSDRGLSGVEMLDAVIYLEMKNYDEAMESINRSIALREKHNEPRRIADALDLRGDIKLAFGDRPGARDDYSKALAIYRSMGSIAGLGKTEKKLGRLG
jgi:tetratricopeptide (TPR) repeat protein